MAILSNTTMPALVEPGQGGRSHAAASPSGLGAATHQGLLLNMVTSLQGHYCTDHIKDAVGRC